MTGNQPGNRLYLLRHGDAGMAERYCGRSDPSLSPQGVAEVKATAAALKEIGISEVLCSPLRRCRETLALLEMTAPWRVLTELREIDFGRWEGKTFAEISATDPDLVGHWARGGDDFTFPAGENLGSFRERITGLARHVAAPSNQTRLLVSHGGVIRHLLCVLLGLPLNCYLLFAVRSGGLCSLDCYPEGAVLTGFNLQGGPWRESS